MDSAVVKHASRSTKRTMARARHGWISFGTLLLLVLLFRPESANAQTLGQVTASLTTCTPERIAGLANQVFATLMCHHPGILVPIEPGHNIVRGPGVWGAIRMFLLPEARDRLYRLAASNRVQLNDTFRTSVEVYMYSNNRGICDGNPIEPGRGRHETGFAVDIQNEDDFSSAEEQAQCCQNISGDIWHFECVAGCSPGPNPRPTGVQAQLQNWSVQAFQLLWNANHPTDQIATNGIYNDSVGARMRVSPANGFARDGCEPDRDADGYPESRDCNDRDAAVHPNAVELCNAVDDNCDRQIDENIARSCGVAGGACRAGSQSCQQGTWSACTGSVPPSVETCDNVDNDCDGEVDEERICAFEAASFYASSESGSTDVDGDGRADACARTEQGFRCLLANGHGFENTLSGPMFALGGEPSSDAAVRLSSSFRMADLDGDHRADLCAIEDRAVRCWRLNPRGQAEVLGTITTTSAVTNLLVADIDGDRAHSSEVCVRTAEGLSCYRLMAREFAVYSQLSALSDEQGFGEPARYGTIRMGDIDGDQRADVCARLPNEMRCWRASMTGFLAAENGPRWSDEIGFAAVELWSTIRLADVDADGRAELCARQPNDTFMCHSWANGQFGVARPGPSLTRANGWENASTYSTLMLADIDASGSLDLCARETSGIRCWLFTGGAFSRMIVGPVLSDLDGWSNASGFRSIRMGDVTGDGLADLCARAPSGLRCYQNTGASFSTLFETGQWGNAQTRDPLTLSMSVRIAGPLAGSGISARVTAGCGCRINSAVDPDRHTRGWLLAGIAMLLAGRRRRAQG